MKRLLRYVLILVAIVIVVAIALPFFVSANAFRPTVEQRLSAALGRRVEVGNLSFSLLSGSLSAESLSIADDPHFSNTPFLTAKNLKVGVELWPLITSKTVNVTGLTIQQPQVNLVRNAGGQWNFSTLATDSSKSSGAGHSNSAPAPAAANKPVPSQSSGSQNQNQADFHVAKLNLENGRLTVGSTASSKKSVYDDVDVSATDVSLKSQFPVTVSAKLPGGGEFKLDGTLGPLDPADASLTPLNAKLNVTGLDLAKTGFVEPGTGLGGLVDLTSDVRSQNGAAQAQGKVLAKQLQLVRGGSPSGVPINLDFNVDYDLRKNSGMVKQGAVKIGQAVAKLTGTFNTQGDSTVVNMNVAGQSLPVQDLQQALPAVGVNLPKGSSLRAGTLNLDLNAQGPVSKLITSGKVGLFNAQLAGFDLGSKLSALSKFAGTQSSGSDTAIQKLTSDVRVAPDGIQSSNLDLVVPALGQLTGSGTVSPSNALNFKMVATLSGQSTAASALGKLTGRNMSGSAKLPFTIQGTMSDPKFVPDVNGLVKSQIGNALGNNPQTQGLSDALGKLFGNKKKK
jgi:AsmA protein